MLRGEGKRETVSAGAHQLPDETARPRCYVGKGDANASALRRARL